MMAINIVGVVLQLVIIGALFYKYRSTRDQGFLWLGLPLVVLPLLSLPLAHGLKFVVDRLARGGRIGFYPFTLVERGEMTIGNLVALIGSMQHLVWSGLLLIAILMLHKAKPSATLSKA